MNTQVIKDKTLSFKNNCNFLCKKFAFLPNAILLYFFNFLYYSQTHILNQEKKSLKKSFVRLPTIAKEIYNRQLFFIFILSFDSLNTENKYSFLKNL